MGQLLAPQCAGPRWSRRPRSSPTSPPRPAGQPGPAAAGRVPLDRRAPGPPPPPRRRRRPLGPTPRYPVDPAVGPGRPDHPGRRHRSTDPGAGSVTTAPCARLCSVRGAVFALAAADSRRALPAAADQPHHAAAAAGRRRCVVGWGCWSSLAAIVAVIADRSGAARHGSSAGALRRSPATGREIRVRSGRCGPDA